MILLWKSLVRSRLDYCCQLWSPTKVSDIQRVEAIQRTFTSRILEVKHLDYWSRLKALNINSLERRRERYLIIYVWKILEGLVPNISNSTDRNIQGKDCPRRGRMCTVRSLKTSSSSNVQKWNLHPLVSGE